MKFVYYSNLNKSAKEALAAGNGKHGKFVVDGNHIAVIGNDGRAEDWVLVLKPKHVRDILGINK